jgi:hypothetical protein
MSVVFTGSMMIVERGLNYRSCNRQRYCYRRDALRSSQRKWREEPALSRYCRKQQVEGRIHFAEALLEHWEPAPRPEFCETNSSVQ